MNSVVERFINANDPEQVKWAKENLPSWREKKVEKVDFVNRSRSIVDLRSYPRCKKFKTVASGLLAKIIESFEEPLFVINNEMPKSFWDLQKLLPGWNPKPKRTRTLKELNVWFRENSESTLSKPLFKGFLEATSEPVYVELAEDEFISDNLHVKTTLTAMDVFNDAWIKSREVDEPKNDIGHNKDNPLAQWFVDGSIGAAEVLSYEWIDARIADVHAWNLWEALESLQKSGLSKDKLEILDWVYTPNIQESIVYTDGVAKVEKLHATEIAFSFVNCCRFSGLSDADAFRDLIVQELDGEMRSLLEMYLKMPAGNRVTNCHDVVAETEDEENEVEFLNLTESFSF
jgi:hypothetical protein